MAIRVKYLPLGVKNMQQKIVFIPLRDINDYGTVREAAKILGVLVSDIHSVEEI